HLLLLQTTCPSGDGYGRKRRGISKRQADAAPAIDDISVGTTVTIAAEEVILEGPAENDEVCMNKSGFVAGIVGLSLSLLIAVVATVYMARKLKERKKALDKANGTGMTSVAMDL
ncbi:uncharacterized protein, partial [Argopecten irradians]|uniref:uncharacterized protein n=1 Tax=Argopecten irradians TaxID=31199 RepID=UPI0037149037